jgi:hypothetical protein
MNNYEDKLYRIWSIIYPHMTTKQILDFMKAMGPNNQHEMYFSIKDALTNAFYRNCQDDSPARKIAEALGVKAVHPDGST